MPLHNSNTNNQDLVILVNKDDQEIGVMDKVEAHRGPAKLHRAISVFLFNDAGELLIQQRSDAKIVGAGQWAKTCCGNVRPGESYEDCAYRRLREELGITDVTIKPIHKLQYSVACNAEFSESEIDQVFMGTYNGEVSFNHAEVQAIQWLPIDEVKKIGHPQLAPWVPIIIQSVENALGNQVWPHQLA